MQDFLKKYGIPIVIFLLLLIAFFTFQTFRKTKGQDTSDYQEKVKLLEREREALVRERETLVQYNKEKDDEIKRLNRVDSLLQKTISSNNNVIYEINKKRQLVNTRINNLSNSELRKFFTDLQ